MLTGVTVGKKSDYIFPCYYVYEPQLLTPESIPTFDLCTHIILIGCTGEIVNSTSVQIHSKPLNCSAALAKVFLRNEWFLYEKILIILNVFFYQGE